MRNSRAGPAACRHGRNLRIFVEKFKEAEGSVVAAETGHSKSETVEAKTCAAVELRTELQYQIDRYGSVSADA